MNYIPCFGIKCLSKMPVIMEMPNSVPVKPRKQCAHLMYTYCIST